MVTILIADPDEDTRIILGTALRSENMAVLEAETAEQAQRLARANYIDVVILNYPMRLATGVTLTRALREEVRQRNVPILNFSSRVTSDVLRNAVVDGVTHTLPKPARIPAVLAAIQSITDDDVRGRRLRPMRDHS